MHRYCWHRPTILLWNCRWPKFTPGPGDVDIGGQTWVANVFANFQRNSGGVLGIIRGRGKLIHKETLCQTSRDTVPFNYEQALKFGLFKKIILLEWRGIFPAFLSRNPCCRRLFKKKKVNNDLFCVDKVDISCAERKKNRKRTHSRTTAPSLLHTHTHIHTHTALSFCPHTTMESRGWKTRQAEDGKQGRSLKK
jgi:hypothetical protein